MTCAVHVEISDMLQFYNHIIIIGERDLQTYLVENKKNGLISQSMMSDSDMQNSMMRTSSAFDTHIALQQREKYFDKLGLDASSGNQ